MLFETAPGGGGRTRSTAAAHAGAVADTITALARGAPWPFPDGIRLSLRSVVRARHALRPSRRAPPVRCRAGAAPRVAWRRCGVRADDRRREVSAADRDRAAYRVLRGRTVRDTRRDRPVPGEVRLPETQRQRARGEIGRDRRRCDQRGLGRARDVRGSHRVRRAARRARRAHRVRRRGRALRGRERPGARSHRDDAARDVAPAECPLCKAGVAIEPSAPADHRRRSSDSPSPLAISSKPSAFTASTSARCFARSRFTLGAA